MVSICLGAFSLPTDYEICILSPFQRVGEIALGVILVIHNGGIRRSFKKYSQLSCARLYLFGLCLLYRARSMVTLLCVGNGGSGLDKQDESRQRAKEYRRFYIFFRLAIKR